MMTLRYILHVVKQKLCRHKEKQGQYSPIAQCMKCGRVRYAGYEKANIANYLGGKS